MGYRGRRLSYRVPQQRRPRSLQGPVEIAVAAETTLAVEAVAAVPAVQTAPTEWTAEPSLLSIYGLSVESRTALATKPVAPVDMRRGVRTVPTLPVAWLPTVQISLTQKLPVERLEGAASPIQTAAAEWSGTLVLGLGSVLPVEAMRGLALVSITDVESGRVVFSQTLPLEWSGSLQLNAIQPVPVEVLAGLGDVARLRVEWTGANQQQAILALPIEAVTQLRLALQTPVESSGTALTLVDQWQVRKKVADRFLDDWLVVAVVESFTLEDTWTVKSVLGSTFTDAWRVLPEQAVTLFNDDIQMPVATVEKIA